MSMSNIWLLQNRS